MGVLRPAPRGRHRLAAALLPLLLTACAVPTPYQPAADTFGYREQQLEGNRYRVSFAGNSVTPRDTVQNYLLYRAAEVTLENHHDYFTVVDQSLERSTIYRGTGFSPFGFNHFDHRHSHFVWPGFTDYSAYPIDSYTAFADIIMADGEKPPGNVNAYDARDVMRRLGPSIVHPDA